MYLMFYLFSQIKNVWKGNWKTLTTYLEQIRESKFEIKLSVLAIVQGQFGLGL
jgi:5-methylcytosine-specific restriction endonuclease McrBC GTP-binding regulatory subunit McrB